MLFGVHLQPVRRNNLAGLNQYWNSDANWSLGKVPFGCTVNLQQPII